MISKQDLMWRVIDLEMQMEEIEERLARLEKKK